MLISKTWFVILQQLTYTFFSFSSSLGKNGLTALDIAEVKMDVKGESLYYHPSKLYGYGAVIFLLKEYTKEESTSPPSLQVSVGNEICPVTDPRSGNSAIFATLYIVFK